MFVSLKPPALGGASPLEVLTAEVCCVKVALGENIGRCGEYVVVTVVNSLRKNALSVCNLNLFIVKAYS